MFTLEKSNCIYLIDGDMNTTEVLFFQGKELFPQNF